MKLVFPNGEHEQVELEAGVTLVGSAEDCQIRLPAATVAPHQAKIELTAGGATIKVFDVTNITRLNGELVAATRFLRSGDALLLKQTQCVVVGEVEVASDEEATEPSVDDLDSTRQRMVLPTFVLRGVSGASFGKNYPIFKATLIGRSPDAEIRLKTEEVSREHAEVSVAYDGLYLEDKGSANGTYVNGKRIRKVKLEVGDEITFDTERFLVQAPVGAASEANRMDRPTDPGEAASNASSKGLAIALAIGGLGAISLIFWSLFRSGILR